MQVITTEPTAPDTARMTRAQRDVLPLTADMARAVAEQHGVCIRPLAMRRIDTSTGRSRSSRFRAAPPGRTSSEVRGCGCASDPGSLLVRV